MASDIPPFVFSTKFDQTVLLGRKAATAEQLLDGIRAVPGSSIYYHTHKFLQQHHYLSPEPPNDFAYWISNVLNEQALGETLSSVDIVQFQHISDLRGAFILILEERLKQPNRTAEAPAGEEFYFMGSRTFVVATPHRAGSLREFVECLKAVSVHSLYYHIFDARLRLEREENDFSIWFRKLGKETLADEMLRLDPYTHTLEGLRNRIIRLVKRHDKD
jgi:uncharacterized protein DUF5752